MDDYPDSIRIVGKSGYMMNFSEEQKQAVYSKASRVCVSAGAGSGKTSVLVARLIDEIAGRSAGVHEILAITFTNKAADEMKRRVADALREKGLFQALRELENAYISTIDSFCARVLKENPVEAGVDPKFSVIEENDIEITIDQMLKDAVQARYSADPDFQEFLLRYQSDRVEKAVREIYRKVRSQGKTLDEAFLSHSCDRKYALRDLNKTLQEMLDSEVGVLKKKREDLFNAVREIQTHLREMGEQSELSWEKIEDIRTFLKDARIKKPRAGGEEHLQGAVGQYQEERDRFLSVLIEEKGKPALLQLKKITTDFAESYESWKQERCVLDFSDLLIKAHQLLSSEKYSVGAYYRNKFKLILLDEFQDTSPLQDQVLECLMGKNSVFLVGDEKQAIYGFRHADVELFRKRKSEFSRVDSKEGHLRLETNYRSSREIISFVNDLCAEWGTEEEDADSTRLFPDMNLQDAFPKNTQPVVEWIVSGNVSNENGDEEADDEEISLASGRLKEAKLLAFRLKEMVETDRLVIYDKLLGAMRPIKYGDMAVLFRARTALPIFERAMREEDLPYFVIGGDSFYRQPEIRDVLSFLSILENPTFDIPLAAVLRSPFIGCADETLLWLGRYVKKYENKDHPLFSGVGSYDQIDHLNEIEKNKIAYFRTLYDKLRTAKDHVSVADLIQAMIRESSFESKMLGERSGRRKLANIMKLIDIAWKYESREAHSLTDFIRYLRDLEVREVEEEEAQVDCESDNVIKLITIHKAKGLEFPVVALADLGSQHARGENSFVTVGKGGKVAAKIYNPVSGELEKPISYEEISTERQAREKEEAQRLFYVAVTRARERIIFSGVTKNKPLDEEKAYHEHSGWMNRLRKAFGFNESINTEGNRTFLFKNHEIRLICSSDYAKPAVSRRASLGHVKLLRDRLAAGKFFDLGSIFTRLGTNEIHSISEQAERIIKQTELNARPFFETADLNVTSLLTYETCPRLFYYRHVLKLPEMNTDSQILRRFAPQNDNADVILSEAKDFNQIAPKDIGTLVHQLLEHIPFDRRFEDNLKFRLNNLDGKVDPGLLETASKILTKFYQSPLFLELSSARRVIKEFPFSLRLKHGTIRGNIDLIYETNAGDIVVADYKTSDVAADEISKEAEVYRTQILLYALAAKSLMRKPVRGAKLFFINTRLAEAASVPVNEECLSDIQEKADSMLQQIAALDFLPHGDKICAYCVTQDFCRRQSEMRESKVCVVEKQHGR